MRSYEVALIGILFFMGTEAFAQKDTSAPKQFIFLDDWSYDFIDYWINSGELEQSFVLNQPYNIPDVEAGLRVQNKWTGLLHRYYQKFYGQPGQAKIILYGRDSFSFVSDTDLPKRSGARKSPIDDVFLFQNRNKNHYNLSAQMNVLLPHLSLVNRTVTNSEFEDEPTPPVDLSSFIFGRINDAYMNVNNGPFDVFLGRIDRNWGTLGSPGLILSDNAYSYDHAQVSYTAKHFRFSMMVTRLEDLPAVDVQSEFPDSVVTARKFMTAHRMDFSISPKLQFSATEIAVYGGPERDFEFAFLNPASYFYIAQRNNQQQINGIWSLDLFYKPKPKINLFLQLLIDDIIVNNEPGKDDRANRPDRLGIHLDLSQAALFARGLQTGIEYTRIGNRTYQSFRTYENFQTRGKGLGYPEASIERIDLKMKYLNLFPVLLKFQTSYQRAGDVTLTSLTDVFTGFKDEKFPIGVVEKSWEARLDMRYFVNEQTQFTATVGYEHFDNYQHVAGDTRNNLRFVLGLRTNLAFGFKVN